MAARQGYLYGECARFAGSPAVRIYDRLRWGPLGEYVWRSRQIRGWARGREAVALGRASASLEGDPVIVEVGSFVGCSAVVLAGARELRHSGTVHCIDPFDGSGDAFSMPAYRTAAARLNASLRECFERNIRAAGVEHRIVVHQQRSEEAASQWRRPIDMLFLDGDQSPAGARAAFLSWTRHLRRGGILAISNTTAVQPGHDGSRRVVEQFVHAPAYEHVRRIDGITFAVRTGCRS